MDYSSFSRQMAAAFVMTMIQAGILGTIVTQNVVGIYFSIALFLFGSVANQFEKFIMQNIAGDIKLFQRPNVPTHGCGDFDTQLSDHTFGFPSGHAQAVGLALVFWYLYIKDQKGYYKSVSTQVSLALMVLIVILICWSRLSNGCHNIIQVITGLLIGMLFGKLSYEIYKNTFL